MKLFLKNPMSRWLVRYIKAKKIEISQRDKKIKIGYMASAINCSFSQYNKLAEEVNIENTSLGDFTYISLRTRISNASIGKFCSIGPDCKIGLGMHPSNTFVTTHPAFFSTAKQSLLTFADKNYFDESKTVTIKNDVWIGANVTVLDGVQISNGVIVAAGSVVTKDIPPYAIVGGVPARIIKFRFDENQIDKLLKTKWWDMDVEFLRKNYKSFHNIKDFIKFID